MKSITFFVLALVIFCASLSGCGTFTGANYVLVSKGQSDGLQGVITGGVGYCKLTVKGESVKLKEVTGEQLKQLCNAVPN